MAFSPIIWRLFSLTESHKKAILYGAYGALACGVQCWQFRSAQEPALVERIDVTKVKCMTPSENAGFGLLLTSLEAEGILLLGHHRQDVYVNSKESLA